MEAYSVHNVRRWCQKFHTEAWSCLILRENLNFFFAILDLNFTKTPKTSIYFERMLCEVRLTGFVEVSYVVLLCY